MCIVEDKCPENLHLHQQANIIVLSQVITERREGEPGYPAPALSQPSYWEPEQPDPGTA